MFRKAISFGGLLLLVGAAVFVMPGSGLAAGHGGGGHGGGGHFGGGHIGGGHFGGGHFGGGHFGGAHFGGHFDRGHFGRGSFGYYPYYGSYGPYSSYTYPSYDLGSYGSYGDVTPSYPDSYSSVTAEPDSSAHITVNVPAGAEVWFDGTATISTGSVRRFDSPPLTPGNRYGYDVKAHWNDNGSEVTQTQHVSVTAGAHVSVSFPLPPTTTTTATTSAEKKN